MKLAFVIFKYFPYGGAQRDMLRIARDCAARGHEVRIYTGQWRGDPPGEGIEVVLLPVSGGLNHRRHRRLIDAITARLHADEPDLGGPESDGSHFEVCFSEGSILHLEFHPFSFESRVTRFSMSSRSCHVISGIQSRSERFS